MSLFNRIPRKARPAVFLSWIAMMVLVADQCLAFTIRAWDASGKTGMDNINTMESSRIVAFCLFVVVAMMFYMVLRWCWHWSDRKEQVARRNQIHVVRNDSSPSNQPA